MAGAHVAGVYRVVVEVLAVEVARLIADEAVFSHGGGIELHLELDVFRNREQRRGGLLYQYLLGFAQRIDIGGDTVAVLRQGLHPRILVVATPEAQHGQEDSLFTLALDKALQLPVVGDTDIEVAVGGEDNAVDRVFVVGRRGQFVGQAYTLPAGG